MGSRLRWLRFPAARRIPAVATLALAVGGCGAGETGREGSIGPDPVWGEGDAWRVQAEPSVVIGAVEGPPESTFGRLGRPARLSDGRVVVPVIEAAEIRWFDRDGAFLMRRGRAGDGPGEYRWPGGVLALPDDTVLVNDLDGARVTWLTPEGEVARMERPPEPERRGPVPMRESRPRIPAAFTDGSLLLLAVVFRGWPDRVGQRWADSLGWFRWTPGGGIETLARGLEREVVGIDWQGRPAPNHVTFSGVADAAVGGGDRLYLAPGGSRFEVTVLEPDGTEGEPLRRPWRPRRPDAGLVERYVAWRMARDDAPTSPEGRADWLRVFDQSPVADTLPATARVLVDATRHVWVEHYRPVGTDPPTWSVFDPEGRWLGEVVTPAGVEVVQIGEGWLLGTRTGPLDIPQVVVHPVTRPPED